METLLFEFDGYPIGTKRIQVNINPINARFIFFDENGIILDIRDLISTETKPNTIKYSEEKKK